MSTTVTNQFKGKWLRLKLRCNGQNFGIKMKPWTKFRKVKKRFSVRSGKPKSSFLLAYQGKVIQADDTPLTIGMKLTKTRIKIEVMDLPSIDEFDLIGLSTLFSIKDLNGLSQLAMNSKKTWIWSNHRNWHKLEEMRISRNTNCLNNKLWTGVLSMSEPTDDAFFKDCRVLRWNRLMKYYHNFFSKQVFEYWYKPVQTSTNWYIQIKTGTN